MSRILAQKRNWALAVAKSIKGQAVHIQKAFPEIATEYNKKADELYNLVKQAHEKIYGGKDDRG